MASIAGRGNPDFATAGFVAGPVRANAPTLRNSKARHSGFRRDDGGSRTRPQITKPFVLSVAKQSFAKSKHRKIKELRHFDFAATRLRGYAQCERLFTDKFQVRSIAVRVRGRSLAPARPFCVLRRSGYTFGMSLLFRDVAGPCLAPGGSIVCVGAFDGVHLGHRALLARVRERADALGLVALAISFEPIPREFFARGAAVPRLATAREKIEYLAEAGMSRVLMLRFDAALAAMSAQAFVEEVLIQRAGVREIMVGADFRFGHARRGDVALLRASGERFGFGIDVMPTLAVDGERISSSAVRAHLAAGEFDAAARMLGRRFTIGGHVGYGQQLGRKLGFPTANIRLGKRASPIGGIFAVRVRGAGIRDDPPSAVVKRSGFGIREKQCLEVWPGVASLGIRPTVNGTEPLLEAHLFDFDGDLYGRRIEVEFVQKLRDEEKFGDLDAMVRQIECDAEQARGILNAEKIVEST
jgi:riboflavin kinase/FMN adenylyltransferase